MCWTWQLRQGTRKRNSIRVSSGWHPCCAAGPGSRSRSRCRSGWWRARTARRSPIWSAPSGWAAARWLRAASALRADMASIGERLTVDYELVYFKVHLFHWQWVKLAGRGIIVGPEYDMTNWQQITMDLKNIGYRDEPFVLMKDVTREFYRHINF